MLKLHANAKRHKAPVANTHIKTAMHFMTTESHDNGRNLKSGFVNIVHVGRIKVRLVIITHLSEAKAYLRAKAESRILQPVHINMRHEAHVAHIVTVVQLSLIV